MNYIFKYKGAWMVIAGNYKDMPFKERFRYSWTIQNPEIIPVFPKLPVNGMIIPKNIRHTDLFKWPGEVDLFTDGTVRLVITKP